MTRRSRQLALAALVWLAGLVGLELALRATGFEHPLREGAYRFVNPDRAFAESGDPASLMEEDEALFWRMRPGWRSADGSIAVRASGFRTPDFDARPSAGTLRVVCLGDSTTFGFGLREADAWPRVLETELRRAGRAAEVLNLGVPGYAAVQGERLLAQVLPRLEPDVVVFAFGAFNDWVPAVGLSDEEQPSGATWHDLRVLQLVARMLGVEPRGVSAPAAGDARHRLESLATGDWAGPRRVPLETYERVLARVTASVRAAGAELVLALQPLPPRTLAANPIAGEYAAATRALAAREGVPCADGWRAFAESGAPPAELFADYCHPSPRGQRLLAAEVARAIGP